MLQYTVGTNTDGRSGHVIVEADDALMAALRVKQENPRATITYVRKRNARGDARHSAARLAARAH
jgi:hypothetical protein